MIIKYMKLKCECGSDRCSNGQLGTYLKDGDKVNVLNKHYVCRRSNGDYWIMKVQDDKISPWGIKETQIVCERILVPEGYECSGVSEELFKI